jgi:DNA invertase Pin-like site-specific DNA recombinase
MKRAAIYARVSTVDRGQDPETQLRQLREYAERRGFALSREYVDRASGAKNDRPEYRAMLDGARRREFEVLLVWRYDRFARSMRELVNALDEFNSLGVDFISYNEGADTTTAQGKLLFGIMASLAEFERSLIAERVKAGMARAKAEGKHTGRPALSPLKRREIEAMLKQKPRPSLRAIARAVGVSHQAVANLERAQTP